MSRQYVHLLDPTGRPLVGRSSLVTSQAAARSYALRQAVAELRGRAERPARFRSGDAPVPSSAGRKEQAP